MIKAKFTKKIVSGRGPLVLDVDLTLNAGDFIALFGASGAGKTTALKILAGLVNPDEGIIIVDNEVWFDSFQHINLPPQKRSLGFVFQEYNLFPNMTLRENLQFALRKNENEKVIDDFLDNADLKEVQDFKPSMLSGGQKQRVAIIRALIRQPKILLLDEPFSALDLPIRLNLQKEILKMHEKFNIPTILVTHDVADVVRLSKRVFIIQDGSMKENDIEVFIRSLG